jgi:hypothetical protein
MTCHPGTRVKCEHCGDWGCGKHGGHIGERCGCWPCDDCGELVPPKKMKDGLCKGCRKHGGGIAGPWPYQPNEATGAEN